MIFMHNKYAECHHSRKFDDDDISNDRCEPITLVLMHVNTLLIKLIFIH